MESCTDANCIEQADIGVPQRAAVVVDNEGEIERDGDESM